MFRAAFVSVFGADKKKQKSFDTLAVFLQLETLLPAHNHVEALTLVPLLLMSSVILHLAMSPVRNWLPATSVLNGKASQNRVAHASPLAELRLGFKDVPVCAVSVCQDRFEGKLFSSILFGR